MLEDDLKTPDRALGAEEGMLSGAEPAPTSPVSTPDSFGGGFSPGSMLTARPPGIPDAPSRDIMADVGYDPARTAAVGLEMGDRLREKMYADSYVDRTGMRRMEEDRGRMARAYEATGAAKDAMPPEWNADKERDKRMRGPMEQFGSIGNVFAMLAGAFTRTPMVTALNAGAAAMTSMQQHDEKGYESAYQAWKDNTQLALKRFDMERAQFTDANTLMNTDMAAWKAKRFAIAAHYEDTKALTLLENGMYPELLEIDNKKIHAARELQQAVAGWEEFENQRQMFKLGVETWQKANPEKVGTIEDFKNRVQVLHDTKNAQRGLSAGRGGTQNPQWLFIQNRVPELMKPTSEGGGGLSSITEAMRVAEQEWTASKQAPAKEGSDPEWIKSRTEQLMKPESEGGKGMDKVAAGKQATEERAASKRADPVVTEARSIADKVKKYEADLRTEKNEDGSAKYTERQIGDMGAQRSRELKTAGTAPSGNRIDWLKGHAQRFGKSMETIDKVENLLRKHGALTGLGGKITRPYEVVTNWFGGNDTDRSQFQSYIEELREWGPRLLNEAGGRPLASEATRINKIIRGLDSGDTTANTARGLLELRQLFKEFREGALIRSRGGDPNTSTPTPGAGWSWESLPEVRGGQ